MDGSTADNNAATQTVPDAVPVTDPFHVVALARSGVRDDAHAPAEVAHWIHQRIILVCGCPAPAGASLCSRA